MSQVGRSRRIFLASSPLIPFIHTWPSDFALAINASADPMARVVGAFSTLDLADPLVRVIGQLSDIGWRSAAILAQGLECSALVRTHLFAGPLHDVDVAGFSHFQQAVGIHTGHRFQRTLQ